MTAWLLKALTCPVLALKALHPENLSVPGRPSWLITPVSSWPTLRVGESAFHPETGKRGFSDPGEQVSPSACSTRDASKVKVIPVAAQLAVELDRWLCFLDDWAKVCALGGQAPSKKYLRSCKQPERERSALGIPLILEGPSLLPPSLPEEDGRGPAGPPLLWFSAARSPVELEEKRSRDWE